MSFRASVVVMFIGIASLAVAVTMSGRDTAGADGAVPNLIVPAFNAEDVVRIEMTSPEGSLPISRTDEGWGLTERGGFPVFEDRAERLLLELSRAMPIEARTDDPALHARLGVAAPEVGEGGGTRVVLRNAQGETLADVIAGRIIEARGLYGMLVRSEGDDQVWWIERPLPASVNRANWIDSVIMSLDASRIDRVRIAHPDGASVVLSASDRERPGAVPMFVEDPAGGADTHPALLRLPGALTGLAFRDVGPLQAVPFPEEAAVVTEFETVDGLVVVVSTIRLNDTEVAARFEAVALDEGAVDEAETINERLGPWVYLITGERAADMRLRPRDLR